MLTQAYSGQINILLKKGKSSDITGYVAAISIKYNIIFTHSISVVSTTKLIAL